MGISSIASHAKGKKHSLLFAVGKPEGKQMLLELSRICTVNADGMPSTSDTAPSEVVMLAEVGISMIETESSGPSTASTKTTEPMASKKPMLGKYLIKDQVTRAEILWALNGVMSHASLRGNANSAQLFPAMFPDSEIAKQFKMQKDKNAYVVTFGLGPYFQDQLTSKLQKCSFYTISFDESLNRVAQKGQMAIIVRFWNDTSNDVSTRYLTSTFLKHATSADLLNAFTTALSEQNLNLKNMLQVSMDGPNVNLKFLRELKAFLKNASDPDDPELFDMGTCSLHVVHGGYKTAHNACKWEVNIFLRSLYYLFKDFPSRRSDFIAASQSSIFPLRFCSIRWVENSAVIQRALQMLPYLKLYVAAMEKKPPASQSFVKIKKALTDNMLAAKLGFLQSIALQLEPFLTQYQSNNSLLPFMYGDLYTLLHNLMARFVRDNVMTGATNADKLMAIDFKKKDNHKTLHSIDIGFAASSVCKTLTGVETLQFKEQCCLFLQHLCGKLTEKCPLNYRLVKGVSCQGNTSNAQAIGQKVTGVHGS